MNKSAKKIIKSMAVAAVVTSRINCGNIVYADTNLNHNNNSHVGYEANNQRKPNQNSIENDIYNALINLDDNVNTSKYGNLDSKQMFEIINKVLDEHSEIFYVDQSNCVYWINDRIQIRYPDSKPRIRQMIAELNQKVDYIINTQIKDSMSDIEKLIAIHNYLVLNTAYTLNTPHQFDAYGILVNGKGVCLGYAESTNIILKKLGMESTTVVSRAMNHAWNIVTIDGQKYHYDATWDDPIPDRRGIVRYKYLALSDEKMSKDHNWDSSEGIVCNSKKYDFMANMDFVVNSSDYIYYLDDEDFNVYKIRKDGSGKERLLNKAAKPISIEGNYLYYEDYYDGKVDKILINNPDTEKERQAQEQEKARKEQERQAQEQEKARKEQERQAQEQEKARKEQERQAQEQEKARKEQERKAQEQEKARKEQERQAQEQEKARKEQERQAQEQEKARKEQERQAQEQEKARKEQERKAQEQEKARKEQERQAQEQEKARKEQERQAQEQEKARKEQERQAQEQEKARKEQERQAQEQEKARKEQERQAQEQEKARKEQERKAQEQEKARKEQERQAQEQEKARKEQERKAQEQEKARKEQERQAQEQEKARKEQEGRIEEKRKDYQRRLEERSEKLRIASEKREQVGKERERIIVDRIEQGRTAQETKTKEQESSRIAQEVKAQEQEKTKKEEERKTQDKNDNFYSDSWLMKEGLIKIIPVVILIFILGIWRKYRK